MDESSRELRRLRRALPVLADRVEAAEKNREPKEHLNFLRFHYRQMQAQVHILGAKNSEREKER